MDIKKGLICPAISGKISYSESELDSNFANNSVSDFDSASESESKSDSSLVFMNPDICIFFNFIFTFF